MTGYSHTQKGMAVAVVLGFAAGFMGLLAFAITASEQDRLAAWVMLIAIAPVFTVLLVIFSRLKVWIEAGALHWAFGSGWPNYRVPLQEIESVAEVRNAWFTGYGIRWFPGGMQYNITGGNTIVEIVRTGGAKIRLGTDEPAALVAAIIAARRSS